MYVSHVQGPGYVLDSNSVLLFTIESCMGGPVGGVKGQRGRASQVCAARLGTTRHLPRLITEYCILKITTVTRYHELGIVYWSFEMCYLIMESLFDSI